MSKFPQPCEVNSCCH